MNRKVPRISRRAWLLAKQNHIEVSNITPTGPDGRIIERDIFRELEKNYLAELPEKTVDEIDAEPAETLAKSTEFADVTVQENIVETFAEKIPELELAVKETAESEEVAEAEETVEEPEELPVEETSVEETAESVTETEDVPVAEPTEPVIEEISETEDEPEIEIEWIETEAEQTAIVAAPIKTIAKDNTQKETDSQETEQEKEKSRSYGTEAYRHTDVIIPRTESAPNGNPITLTMSFDAGAIVKLNTLIKEHGETMGLPHITINDMILFATAKLLKKNKALNAHFLGDKIRYFDGAHLGFSVDTGHGIETLTVFDADRLSLSSLAKITGALIRSVRAGGVSPEKNKLCASFMVSNLGTLGVESFTPVLKEPQTGVLGVCALQRRIKEVNGKDISYSCIPLSLTFDPRALDTTSAAGFLRELCVSLENFELLLIK